MAIIGWATSYTQAEEQLDAYEADHLAPSAEGAALTRVSWRPCVTVSPARPGPSRPSSPAP
jgi:hypothetical protein